MKDDLPGLGSHVLGANISINNLDAYNKHVIGRILTIIDASLPPGRQTDSIKQLIKQDSWAARDKVWSWMSHQSYDEKTGMGTASSFPFSYDTPSPMDD